MARQLTLQEASYIVWVYGLNGWSATPYATLEAALRHDRDGKEEMLVTTGPVPIRIDQGTGRAIHNQGFCEKPQDKA